MPKGNLKYTDEFKNFLVILGTYSPCVLDLFWQNLEELTIQSIRYYHSNSEDMLTDPTLCFENVAQFKRFLDSVGYDGPIAAMTDNTKLKPRLQYSSRMGCIVGSTLSNNETNIKTYNDISVIINKIKENNVVAKYIRAYILQVSLPKFPSVIGSDKTETILDIHKLLLDFAQELKLHIISIGSDGAQVEFNAQTQLQQISTPRYQFEYNQNFIENDQINLLRTWPNDNQIWCTFDQSHQIACNLAEYLRMLTPNVIPINSLQPYVLITSNDIKVSGSNDENIQNDKNSNENLSNSNYSQIISCAANEKNDQKSISQFIADLYEKEQLNKQKTLFSNQNLIKNTNINYDNSLSEQDYVIAYYGTQLCIGQVISSFYEAYGYHSYNQEPITDIKNISYLTLKVFTPIRNIFSAEVEGGHVLITHQCPKNILYHLNTQDIQIFDNTLQLLEKAKA
ncbi:42525_t:CDS:2, partial [Gigaspora margarita]